MKIKQRFWGVFLLFFMLYGYVSPAFSMSFADYVYFNVNRNRADLVQGYLQKGYSINSVNPKGMSPLCLAVMHKDYISYRDLLKMGADANHRCMKKVDQKTASKFAKAYYGKENVPLLKPAPVAKSVVAKGTSVEADNTELYIGAGVLAAGAVATGIILSHDSKDKSPAQPLEPCPENSERNGKGQCVCNYGYKMVGDVCVEIQCPVNSSLNSDGTGCVCNYGYKMEGDVCVKINCPEHSSLNPEGTECVCDSGYRMKEGQCQEMQCPPNTVAVGNTCVARGFVDIVVDSPTSTEDVYAVKSPEEDVYNLYSVYTNQSDKAEINIRNNGEGNSYGVYGNRNVTNAMVTGHPGGQPENINEANPGTGNITIVNNGSGNAYGIYSEVPDASQYRESINSLAARDGVAYGNINITASGGGAGYGVFGAVRAYNAYTEDSGESYGNIKIKGNGDIYGVSGYSAVINAVTLTGGKSKGVIDIDSVGNGDVYGIKVDKGNVPTVGVTSWFSQNALAFWGGEVTGLINIHNTGDGNVYGMYGGEQLHNAYNSGKAKGDIDIVNLGNGNVYGMYVPGSGWITNVTADNDEDGINEVQSEIRLVNVGNGVATGIRGGYKSNIVNSGTIDINNVGEGTAVGIYAENSSTVNNSGTINIHSDTFVDNYGKQEGEEGTTYTPNPNSGTAYGIYAEKGASVVNEKTGEIHVSGAFLGHSVYLEKGAEFINRGVFESAVRDGSVIDIYGDRAERDSKIATSSVLDTNDWGEGSVVLGHGGQFFADELKGEMGVSREIVQNSMNNEYIEEQSLNADKVDELKLVSQSAMFDAEKKKNNDGGYDVVLKRKNLEELLENKELGKFFEKNYNEEKGEEVFDYLKSASSVERLNTYSNEVSGANLLPNFRYEDALVYRGINKQFNDGLFNKPNDNYIAGYKYIDISTDKDGALVGNDGTAHVAYGMLKGKADNGVVYGLGLSIGQLKSDYDNGADRKSNMFGLWAPVGYEFNNGVKWFSKLYAGYGDNSYTRKNDLGIFEADYDEYQYGLSNEVRYKLNLFNGIAFEPLAELNLLGAYRKSFDEGEKVGAIRGYADDYLSLEGGLGAYLTKEMLFNDTNKLRLQIGGIYYVEFLDPDDSAYSLYGFSDAYRLSNKSEHGRGVFSLRANYDYKNLTIYGAIEKELGKNDALVIDTGVQYKF